MADADARPDARVAGGRRADLLLALFVGGAAFLAIAGVRVLDVRNIGWLLSSGDSATHYLGWEFFRRAPWTWPPGLNPDYGLQFSSSIIFSDSIPLLALPLKLLSPLLPDAVQYTGWWLMACFLLQAYVAVRLAGLFSSDAVVKLGVAVLLSFAPPMLWRVSVHYSLVAHWIVLAAIYLYWAPAAPRRWLHWTLLLGASALIHTYFLAMCAPIWLAAMLRHRLLGHRALLHRGAEIVVVLAVALGALWLGGFFPLRPSMLSFGYGFYRLNALALINPDGGLLSEHWAWSSWLPMLAHGIGDYEGFAYAGLGGLAALALSLPLLWTERRAYRGTIVWPLAVVALGLTAFALSPNLAVGPVVFRLPVPDIVFELASSMRSSGRFFWPVYYLLALAAAWLLHRAIGDRAAGPLLLLLAALQVCDTYPGWSTLRARLNEPAGFATSLDDARLAAVAGHYRAVRMLPASNGEPGWDAVAAFALHNRLPTDAVYLARPDGAGYDAYMAGIEATIARHGLDREALYVLDRRMAFEVGRHMTGEDAMFRAGDFYLFAPGWTGLGGATTLPPARPWSPL